VIYKNVKKQFKKELAKCIVDSFHGKLSLNDWISFILKYSDIMVNGGMTNAGMKHKCKQVQFYKKLKEEI